MLQSGFFDLEDKFKKLDEKDPLIKLTQLIDWEMFRSTLEKVREKERKSKAGRKPYDVVLMFKVLILQHLYNISDDETEYQIRDRLSFSRFLGLKPEQSVPDAKTIWLFREQLVKLDLIQELFMDFDIHLTQAGFMARKGQIIDASFVEVPKQRNSKEENDQIKVGIIPDRIADNDAVKSQKDCDARWTKKNNQSYYGYKNPISIDNKHKLIRSFEVTSAEVHDSQKFIDVLSENTSQDTYVDSAYGGEEYELTLKALGYRPHIIKKAFKNKPLTERDKARNKRISKIRARVEHVFGSITNEQGGLYSRVIGSARTTVKVGMMNLTYNIRRFTFLCR